jgi:hypothetical protein
MISHERHAPLRFTYDTDVTIAVEVAAEEGA